MAKNPNRARTAPTGVTGADTTTPIDQASVDSAEGTDESSDEQSQEDETKTTEQEQPPEQVEEATTRPEAVASVEPVAEVIAPVVEVTPEVTETVTQSDSVLVPNDEDDANKAQLRALLNEFVIANSVKAKNPEAFTESAKLSVAVAKFIIAHPKTDILDLYLEFFKENPNDVCNPLHYMKGSTTLPKGDERIVGTLFGLFNDLASGVVVRINAGHVTAVLTKPEFANYTQRKISVLTQ
jgi:hypothetical protein